MPARDESSIMISISSSVKPLIQPVVMNSSVVPRIARSASVNAQQLGVRRQPRRYRIVLAVVVGGRQRGRKAQRTGPQRGLKLGHDGAALVSRRSRCVARRTHHGTADGRVADEETGVDADGAFEAGRGTRRSCASPSASPCSSAASGMPSTRAIMRLQVGRVVVTSRAELPRWRRERG